ncbi:MAG: C39 family peptidase [Bacteroidales bacterium]|nr:C39 family peptidase [Bacteroidales bacterium]
MEGVFFDPILQGLRYKSDKSDIVVTNKFRIINIFNIRKKELGNQIKSRNQQIALKSKKGWNNITQNLQILNIDINEPYKFSGTDVIVDEGYIYGVPYYHQDWFGVYTCSPTSIGQALGYWDGLWPNLIDWGDDSWENNSQGVTQMVEDLKITLNWSSGNGVEPYNVDNGTEEFCNDSYYSNNLDFDVFWYPFPTWSRVKNNVDEGAPMVLNIDGTFYGSDGTKYNMGHSMTIVGFREEENPDMKVVIFHPVGDTWDQDFEVNWDMPFWTDNDLYEITPGGDDNINPTCTITSPNSGGTFSGLIPIEVNVSDASGIWRVEYEYSLNGTSWFPIGTINGPQTEWTIQFNTYAFNIVYDNSVWVRAMAVDNYGNVTWDECDQSFIVDNQGPQPTSIAVSINLTPNSTTPGSIVTVSGSAIYDLGTPVTSATVTISSSEDSWTTSVNENGLYNRNIYAPSSSGYINVVVSDGLLSGSNQAYITVSGGGPGNNFDYDYSVICEDVESSDPWDPINITRWIRSDFTLVNCWTRLEDLYVSVRTKWEWYKPDGNLLGTVTSDYTTDPGGGYYDWWKMWSNWTVSGTNLANMEGRHNVDIYVREYGESYDYMDSQWWVMSYDFKEHQMCKDVQENDPWNPINPTNTFYQTDERAITWSRFTDISEEVEVRTEFYEPNGTLYFTFDTIIEDPGVGYYYPEYKEWTWIWIDGYSAQNKCGNWILKKYEKDPSGSWDELYDDNFVILESPNVNPSVSVNINPTNPIEGESVSLQVMGSDNTYIEEVELFWDDGTLHNQLWSDIFSNNFSENENIGSFNEGDEIEIWAKILDTSGNLFESSHVIIIIGDSDEEGPIVENFNVTEHNGNGNGIIEPTEEVKIECDISDISGVSEVHFFVDGTEVTLNGNYYSYCGPFDEGSHNVIITAIDDDNTPAYTTFYGDFEVEHTEFFVDLNVFLEGPFIGTNMNTNLISLIDFPFNQPYSTSPWNYFGDEVITSLPNSDIVDWVLVELRDASEAIYATSNTIVDKQAAFLLNDGSVVSLDGSSNLQFDVAINQNLFVAVWHRNHLGILSSQSLTEVGGIYSYDFTISADQALGGASAQKELSSGIWGMVGADADANGIVNESDKNNWSLNAGKSGYLVSDFNLNGEVENNDKNEVWRLNMGYSTQIPFISSEGLVAYYPFNGDAIDATGNGNDGQPFGGVNFNVVDRFGDPNSASYYDGIDDYVWLGENTALNPPNFSICSWFSSTNSNGNRKIYRWRHYGITVELQDGFVHVEYCGTTTFNSLYSDNLYSDGIWHFVAFTYDGSYYRLFIDSQEEDFGFSDDPVLYSYGGASIGRDGDWSGDYFEGFIDDVRIYDRALNVTEINQLFNEPSEWQCGDQILDERDGQSYNTVQIGDQCWMAENLNIGVMIPGSSTQINNGVIEKYCTNDLVSNCDIYGGLYIWEEMMNYTTVEGPQGICPIGWHIPTNAELSQIINFLGGQQIAGGKMKESGTAHWLEPNVGATNSSGFTALGSGRWNYGFSPLKSNTCIHSSTESSGEIFGIGLHNDSEIAYWNYIAKTHTAYSVRCIKDSDPKWEYGDPLNDDSDGQSITPFK